MGLFSTSISYFIFSGLHFVCFALALTVCGLYGKDLNNANHLAKYADSKWVSVVVADLQEAPCDADWPQVYAVVVGAMSAVTCVIYFIPFVLRKAGIIAAAWSFILFILWIAVFGIFGAVRERGHRGARDFMLTLASRTAVHQGGLRGRRRHPAHEERRLGGPGQRPALAHLVPGPAWLLVEAP